MDLWFLQFEGLLEEMGLWDPTDASKGKPRQIWNVDEKGVEDIPHVRRVVGVKGQDTYQLVAGEKGSRSTILAMVNANGDHVPPMVIHKGMRVQPGWDTNKPQDTMLRCSKSGYINKQLFAEYGARFVRFLNSEGLLGLPHLLLMDSHFSHLYNYQFIDMMQSYNIQVLGFRPHTTHLVQPLDKNPFSMLDHHWNVGLRRHNTLKGGRKLTKSEFFGLFNVAWYKAMTPHTIQSGFKRSGIYPPDKTAIPLHKLEPAQVTDMCEFCG